jgi:hypothetical protein
MMRLSILIFAKSEVVGLNILFVYQKENALSSKIAVLHFTFHRLMRLIESQGDESIFEAHQLAPEGGLPSWG